MQNNRNPKPLRELDVQVPEVPSVIFAADQVPGGMVRQSQSICPRLDLSQTKLDRGLFHLVQTEFRFSRVVQGHQQKRFHSEAVIAQRPRPHGFADDRDFVPEFAAQYLDGLNNTLDIGVIQKVRGNVDVLRLFPDRLAHLHRRPIVLLLPLNLAAQRRRFLDDAEHRHDGVKTELSVAGRGETSHQFGLPISIRERCVHEIHQLNRGNRSGIAGRRAVYTFAPQRSQHALAACHRSDHVCLPFYFC